MEIDNLDVETEQVLVVLRQNSRSIYIHGPVQQFINIQMNRYYHWIEIKEYKICFKILNKMQVVLGQTLKKLGNELTGFYTPVKELLLILLDEQRQYSLQDKNQVMKSKIQLQVDNDKYDDEVQSNLTFFMDCFDSIVCCINNLAYIYLLRDNISKALCYLYRAAIARLIHIDSYRSYYHMVLICLNLAAVYRQQNQYDDAVNMITKSITELERLDSQQVKLKFMESRLYVQNYLEYYMKEFFDFKLKLPQNMPYVIIQYNLCLSYQFFATLLEYQNKKADYNICKTYYTQVYNMYMQIIVSDKQKTNSQQSKSPALEDIRGYYAKQKSQKQLQLPDEKGPDFEILQRITPKNNIIYSDYIEDLELNVVFTLLEQQFYIEVLVYSYSRDIKQRFYLQCDQIETTDFYSPELYKQLASMLIIDSDSGLIKMRKYRMIDKIK
ncbi:hypothetical protein pb186bvf_013250 [Paramecium bursaria]